METQRDREKLFVFCLEELRLLIERPYEHYGLLERLTTIRNKLEQLYEQTFMVER